MFSVRVSLESNGPEFFAEGKAANFLLYILSTFAVSISPEKNVFVVRCV